jgi:Protein of unknown function (DUF4013)
MPLSLNLDDTEPPEPSGPSGVVTLRACFASPFGDPNWLRTLLIGGVLTALGGMCTVSVCFWTFSPFTLAPFAGTLRAAAAGETTLLPNWAVAADFGQDFDQGLSLIAVCIVYSAAALLCLAPLPAALAFFGGGEFLRRAVEEFAGLPFLALICLMGLSALPVSLLLPAALARATVRDSLRAGLEVKRVLAFVRANLGNYLRSLVIGFLATFLGVAVAILCVMVSIIAYVLLLAAGEHSDLVLGLAAVVLGTVIVLGVMGAVVAFFCSQLVFARALGETVRLHPTSV